MAITNGYATLAEWKSWTVTGSTNADDDSVVEDCIEAASRYIDGESGRTFYARTETRYFDVPGSRSLRLDDDLIAITTLTNGDGTVITSGYNLIPKNKAPYWEIRLKDSSSTLWMYDGDGNYEMVFSVAGTWGYASTAPHDIRQACLMIADSMYRRRVGESTSSTVKITAAGVVITPQDVPSIAAGIIQKYRRRV